MTVKLAKAITTMAFCAIAVCLPGCGGGGSGIVNVAAPPGAGALGNYQGNAVGSVVFRVVLPVNQSSPAATPAIAAVDLEVTGEGLAEAHRSQLAGLQGQTQMELPVGQKGVYATARDGSGQVVARGFESVVVESGAVKNVVIRLGRAQAAEIAQARALVQEVRDATVALGATFGKEVVNQALVWGADLVPTYGLTMQRLDFVGNVLMDGHLALTDHTASTEEPQYFGSITELPAGTYRTLLQQPWPGSGGWDIWLLKTGSSPDENTWIVNAQDGEAVTQGLTVTFKRTPKTNNLKVDEGEFTVTSSADPVLKYEGKLVLDVDAQNRVTKMTVTGRFKDKYLQEPDGISVDGTLTGEPLGKESYQTASFTGSLESNKLSLSVEQATATWAPPSADAEKWENFLKQAELKNFRFQTKNVAEPMTVSGTLTLSETTFDGAEQVSAHGFLPKTGQWTGTYQSPTSTFEGSVSFDWQNPQRELTELPKGTAEFKGRVAAANKPVFSLALTLDTTKAASGDYAANIDLTRGQHYLRGTYTAKAQVADRDLEVTDWSLNLKNESNLTVAFSQTGDGGTVTGGSGEKLADIRKDPDLGLLMVRYVDGTVESLEPAGWDHQAHPLYGTVTGRIVNANTKEPIAGASVTGGYDSTVTDEKGLFQMRTLAGSVTLHVAYGDFPVLSVPVVVAPNAVTDLGDVSLVVPRARWTFMVYMNADNDLEEFAIQDFNEMERVGSSADVNIVALVDRSGGYDSSNGNWTDAREYYITRDSDSQVIHSQILAELGEIDMGDPEQLKAFVRWAMTEYPADNYVLDMWNHGAGFRSRAAGRAPITRGFSFDDTQNTHIRTTALPGAIQGPDHIDILAWDSSLMQMMEIADQVGDAATFMVGSEESPPGDGYPYQSFLSDLIANPALTPEAFAILIVDDTIRELGGAFDVTQSALRLSQLPTLRERLSAFADTLIDAIPQYALNIAAARGDAQRYGHGAYTFRDYKDIQDFAEKIKAEVPSSAVQSAAGAVIQALTNALVAEGHSGFSVRNSHGLSIYVPQPSDYLSSYDSLHFALNARWDEFIQAQTK